MAEWFRDVAGVWDPGPQTPVCMDRMLERRRDGDREAVDTCRDLHGWLLGSGDLCLTPCGAAESGRELDFFMLLEVGTPDL